MTTQEILQGVHDWTNGKIVYDISVAHPDGQGNPTKYADLAAALDSNNGGGVPASLQRGGMSVKFVRTYDNNYIQARCMAQNFTTDVTQWQGVDDKPTAGSENVVKSGGVHGRLTYLNEKEITQESIIGLKVRYMPGVIDSADKWECIGSDDINYYGFYLQVFAGDVLEIKKNSGGVSSIVCALLNNIEDKVLHEKADFIDYEGFRGRLTYSNVANITVPIDCYLWVELRYLNIIYNPDSITINGVKVYPRNLLGEMDSLAENTTNSFSQINQELDSIEAGVSPLELVSDDFYETLKFNGESSVISLTNPIILSQNGDSIEFTVDSIDSSITGTKFYSFSNRGGSNVAIAVRSDALSVRASDSTWICQKSSLSGLVGARVKILYEDSKIKTYIDATLINTYDGLKTLQIDGFGYNSSYGYWKGSISNLKVNGNKYNIENKGTVTNVEVINNGSFLIGDEKNEILPKLYFEKTSTKCSIYVKTTDGSGTYIKYPLNYRYLEYSAGAYPSFYDNWGIGKVSKVDYVNGKFLNEVYLFQGGEAELAIRVPREGGDSSATYVGGSAHGFENVVVEDDKRKVTMLLNGQLITEDSVIPLCAIDTFEMWQDTELCQAYSNSNPWSIANKHWIFDANGLSITTKLKIVRELQISNSMFGMMCVYRRWDGNTSNNYLTNKATKDTNIYKIYDVSDGWSEDNTSMAYHDHDCRRIFEWGEKSYGFEMNIINPTIKPNGSMYIGTNASLYNKIYFDLTGSYTPELNEVLEATQKWYIGKIKQE